MLEGSIDLGTDLWWGGDFESLLERLLAGSLKSDNVRFFLGYSGWGSGQLMEELIEDTWIVGSENLDLSNFDFTSEELWRNLLKNMGGEFKVIANYPVDPRLN
jgi:putative transcriptional regulator